MITLKDFRESIITDWNATLEMHMQRVNDSMYRFRLHRETDDLTHLAEDCGKVIEVCNHMKEIIAFMDANNIK